jgi:hypothetical protein
MTCLDEGLGRQSSMRRQIESALSGLSAHRQAAEFHDALRQWLLAGDGARNA